MPLLVVLVIDLDRLLARRAAGAVQLAADHLRVGDAEARDDVGVGVALSRMRRNRGVPGGDDQWKRIGERAVEVENDRARTRGVEIITAG